MPLARLILIGLEGPAFDVALRPEMHVAVYFGVVNALPLACAALRGAKSTSSVPGPVLEAIG